jgi:hypothetical protein
MSKFTNSGLSEATNLLRIIIISQSHSVSLYDTKEAIKSLVGNMGSDDFNLEYDGAEYRIIEEDAIWEIYVDTIKELVDDCYDLKLDDIPDFIALTIDWEQTAENAYRDGYGHTFSGYDGSEKTYKNYYIFRTN